MLSETCYTGLLMSADPIQLHFFCTVLSCHSEHHHTVYDSVPPCWAADPAARSLARLSLKVETSDSWRKPAAREVLYLDIITNRHKWCNLAVLIKLTSLITEFQYFLKSDVLSWRRKVYCTIQTGQWLSVPILNYVQTTVISVNILKY